jgi:dimethylargininase
MLGSGKPECQPERKPMATALVRGIPASYARATRGAFGDPGAEGPIDVALARSQHAAYADALRSVGFHVQVVPGDGGSADATFVEDLAVVVGRRALVCRPGHAGRRGEAEQVDLALTALGLQVERMGPDDGVLEGGDVLRMGSTLYVGRSARPDEGGVDALRAAFPEVLVVPVTLPEGILHLKCVVTSPAPGLVLLAEATLDPRRFAPARVLVAPGDEPWAANVVGARGRVVAAAGNPGTASVLRGAGLEVLEVAFSELHKGDGSPTCLSVLVT